MNLFIERKSKQEGQKHSERTLAMTAVGKEWKMVKGV